jgi:cytochrome c5
MMRGLFILLALPFCVAPAMAGGDSDGKRIFDRVCSACHVNSLSEAPQIKTPAMWTARLAKGRDALYHSALNGFVGPTGEEMPPRGGRPELTDAEVRAAVDFIINTVNSKRNAP